MFTPFPTVEPYIEPTQPRTAVLLSPRSLGWLPVSQHRGPALAPCLLPSVTVVPLVSCALCFALSPSDSHSLSQNQIESLHQDRFGMLGLGPDGKHATDNRVTLGPITVLLP